MLGSLHIHTCLGQVITAMEKRCFNEHRVVRAIAKVNEICTVLTDVNQRARRKLLEACVRTRLQVMARRHGFPMSNN